jgi:hypothetical protein
LQPFAYKGVAEALVSHDDTEHDDGTAADASGDEEFDVPSMTAICPVTPLESHFCFDGRSLSAFETFEELADTNAGMDATALTNVISAFKQIEIHVT